MTALTNFNNFELNTNEKENVNGGWGCYGGYRTRSYSYSSYCYGSYSNCYSSYSNCYSSCDYSSCEPAEETVEAAPVVETASVIETPESLTPPRGGVAGL